MNGEHSPVLVLLSVLIAVFASFTALDIANRIRADSGSARQVWLWAAAIALGSGIWAMHFVAMLAFRMPGMQMSYEPGLTVLSLVLAIAFTGAGFAVMGSRRFRLPHGQTVAAGLLMGLGVVAMHYVGMSAMRMPARISYQPGWLVASVLIAIGAAITALWLADRDQKTGHRVVAALAMGAAISGMHYAGMAGAVFTPTGSAAREGLGTLDQAYLAIAITGITVLILLLALGAARLERLLSSYARREARIALRLKLADILRNGGTLDALQEIAALMGQHFGACRAGYGQLDPVEDVFHYDVCWTDGAAPPLIGTFPAAAFGVKIVESLKSGQTVAIEDLLTSPLSDESRTRETAREVDTRSVLVVPFVREGRLSTIVYLNDRRPRPWRADDIDFMQELAERTRLVLEREAVEAKLRDLNANLEARVEARSAELRQAQAALAQSQKMEAVGQLVSGIAHDFNNVLGAVVGAFELISRRAEQPERVRYLAETGLEAAERGSKLTRQLLAFSRSQSIQLQPLLVCDVIENLRDLLARTLGPSIVLDLRLNRDPVPVLADATQVEMMVLNLAINARDAMPDGGALIISTSVLPIRGDAELKDGDYVEMTVSDTGSGMDEPTLRRAMDPFFTTKPIGKGTGLGLAQIYGSARQAGGTVRIESTLGAGTTVRVFLPRTDQAPVTMGRAAQTPDTAPDRPLKVLIVDDDHHHRTLLAAGVEALGHQVTHAIDGVSALSALEAGVPDVILLDFAMPVMNGAQVAEQVRLRWPDLPIIFTSGMADTQAIIAAVGENVRLLPKPFRASELQQVLNRATQVAEPITQP